MSIKQLRMFHWEEQLLQTIHPKLFYNSLTNLLQRMNKNMSLETDALYAFNARKTALVNFTKLSYIKDDPQKRLILTDAGVGAVTEQECDSQRKSTAFFQLSFHQHREDTAPFHTSYWQYTWQLNILGIFWKEEISLFTPTTSL